jgi:hypothetical protein
MGLSEVVKDAYHKQDSRIERELCRAHSHVRFVFTAACVVLSFCRTESYVLLCGRLSEILRFYILTTVIMYVGNSISKLQIQVAT